MDHTYWHNHHSLVVLFIILGVWDMVWKGIGLWRSGRDKQLGWFLVMFIINSAGILPIIYVLTHKTPQPKGAKKQPKISA